MLSSNKKTSDIVFGCLIVVAILVFTFFGYVTVNGSQDKTSKQEKISTPKIEARK